eukprot:1155106-Pelagomonas_calceolata.AAC.6
MLALTCTRADGAFQHNRYHYQVINYTISVSGSRACVSFQLQVTKVTQFGKGNKEAPCGYSMSWLPLSLLYLAAHCLSAVLSDAVASVSNVPAFVYALNDASIQEVRIDARELRCAQACSKKEFPARLTRPSITPLPFFLNLGTWLDDGSWPAEIVKIDVNRSVLVKPASTAQGYPYLDLGKHFSRIYLQEGSALTFQQRCQTWDSSGQVNCPDESGTCIWTRLKSALQPQILRHALWQRISGLTFCPSYLQLPLGLM